MVATTGRECSNNTCEPEKRLKISTSSLAQIFHMESQEIAEKCSGLRRGPQTTVELKGQKNLLETMFSKGKAETLLGHHTCTQKVILKAGVTEICNRLTSIERRDHSHGGSNKRRKMLRTIPSKTEAKVLS
jgi:hypothetical protein